MEFRGSWFLKTPECLIFGFLIEFSFVLLHPRSNVHIVSLVPCLCLSFDILVLKYSYEALLINVMIKYIYPPYTTFYLRLQFDLSVLLGTSMMMGRASNKEYNLKLEKVLLLLW